MPTDHEIKSLAHATPAIYSNGTILHIEQGVAKIVFVEAQEGGLNPQARVSVAISVESVVWLAKQILEMTEGTPADVTTN